VVTILAEIYNKDALLGSMTHDFNNISENCQKYDFGLGSSIFNNSMVSAGSAVIIDGNFGVTINIRKNLSTGSIITDFSEMEKRGEDWKRTRLSPSTNYPEGHYWSPPLTFKVFTIGGGSKQEFAKKLIE
jgi:hypothetical protein